MMKKISFIVILIIVLLMTIPLNTTHAQPATTIQVAPATSTVGAGSTFTVNITVTNVTDLAVWEFQVWYLITVVNCIGATQGPFLEKGGNSQSFWSTMNNAYNATHGWLLLGSTLLGAVPGVNGSGTLATITFHANAAGDTPLHFDNDPTWSFLEDSTPPPRHTIPYTAVDGTVHVTGGAHDLAVTAVTLLKTSIGQTYTGNVNVTIQNLGGSTETFNLTLYANATVIDTIKNIVLQSAISKNVTFTWDTTGFAMGSYAISAYAWPVPGETNTANNNLTGSTLVKVSIPGDVVDPHFKVDMGDISAVLDAFGSRLGADGSYWHSPPRIPPLDPHSPNMDIDNNGQVDMGDVTIALGNFGKHFP